MAIQISGTTVIDNSRNLTNIVSYGGPGIATQAEAEAGTNNDQLMTPLRVKQAIDAGGASVINRIQRGISTFTSGAATTPITSVNTGKAFISSSIRGNASGAQSGGPTSAYAYGFNGVASIELISATSLRYQGGSGLTVPSGWTAPPVTVGQTGAVAWEVIEFV
jgi:hypothetical protein